MKFEFHHHYHGSPVHCSHDVERKFDKIFTFLEKVMATQAELAAELRMVKDNVAKLGTETQGLIDKVNELTAMVENGPITAELREAVDAVKAQVKIVDDLVPDAP